MFQAPAPVASRTTSSVAWTLAFMCGRHRWTRCGPYWTAGAVWGNVRWVWDCGRLWRYSWIYTSLQWCDTSVLCRSAPTNSRVHFFEYTSRRFSLSVGSLRINRHIEKNMRKTLPLSAVLHVHAHDHLLKQVDAHDHSWPLAETGWCVTNEPPSNTQHVQSFHISKSPVWNLTP